MQIYQNLALYSSDLIVSQNFTENTCNKQADNLETNPCNYVNNSNEYLEHVQWKVVGTDHFRNFDDDSELNVYNASSDEEDYDEL